MSTEKCDINFEMSSEEMLSIFPQPKDTCIDNHPLCNSMSHYNQEMRVAVADAPDEVSLLEEIDFDEDHINGLQESINGFFDWFKDLKNFYEDHLDGEISPEESVQYDEILSQLNDQMWENDGFYLSISVAQIMEDQNELITKINESMEKSCQIHLDFSAEIENDKYEISKVEEEIECLELEEHDYADMEALTKKRDKLTTLFEDKECNEPWDEACEETSALMDEFEATMNNFGEDMQNHFTKLREMIGQLKTMIKHNVSELDEKNGSKPRLSYPNERLKELLSNHSKKDEIITAASPSVFIRKIQGLEEITSKLDEEDKESLFIGYGDEAMNVALKRFNMDYPNIKTLLTHRDDEDAKNHGARKSIDVEDSVRKVVNIEDDFSY